MRPWRRAFLADPDDDTTLLTFADWIAERDDFGLPVPVENRIRNHVTARVTIREGLDWDGREINLPKITHPCATTRKLTLEHPLVNLDVIRTLVNKQMVKYGLTPYRPIDLLYAQAVLGHYGVWPKPQIRTWWPLLSEAVSPFPPQYGGASYLSTWFINMARQVFSGLDFMS